MARLLEVGILIGVVYGLPLVDRPELMISAPILLTMLFGVVVVVTQPATVFGRAAAPPDRGSIRAILASATIGQTIAVAEFAHADHHFQSAASAAIGLTAMVGGLALRLAAIRTLGRFFTSDVRILPDQRLLTDGVYAHVRHPSYTGAWMGFMGCAVFLGAPIGATVIGVALLAAYVYRIHVEEQALLRAFGDEYRTYQARSRRLIPRLW